MEMVEMVEMGRGPAWVMLALMVTGVTGSSPLATPFLEEPSNGSAVLGEGAELRCRVRGGVAAQWGRDGLLLGAPPTAHPRYRLVGDPQRGEHHLRIRPVSLEDDAEFRCQAGEGNGTRPQSSRPALLTVLVPPGTPRLELEEGAELPLVGGAEVQVRCHAPDARPPAHLELTLGGRPLPDVSIRVSEGSHPKLSSSQATARLTPGPSDLGTLLVCSASNAAGAAPAEAKLRLDVLVPPSAPSIEGLESPQVRAGQTLKLVCVARGGNPPPSLHWDKDGRPLEGSWSRDSDHVTRNRLVLSVTPEDDGAILRCRAVTSLPGGGDSASVRLEVTYPPSEVTLWGSGTVALNGSAALGCTSAPSNPPVRLRWWLGGRELEPSGGGPTPGWGRGRGAVSNLTLWGRVEDHGQTLLCEAETPGVGTRSASVTVSVSHPPQWLWLEAPPPNVTFRLGDKIRLLCHARGGHPPPKLTWTKEGRPLAEAPPQSRAGHVTSRELLVTATPSDNGATYRCQSGTRGAGTRLRVTFPPLGVSISVSPREPRPGHALTLTCLAGPAHPTPQLTWLRPGHAPEPGQPLPPSPAPHGGVTARSRLLLQGALSLHGQPITCRAWSPALGVAVSSAHQVLLWHPPQVSAPSPVVVPEGSVAVLGVSVQAHPPPEPCTWSLRGRDLQPQGSPRLSLSPGGALVIANVTRADSAPYRVWCANAEGGAGSDVTLIVQAPPSIVRAPDPVVVAEGGEGQLLCEAEGSPLPPGSLRWARLGEGPDGEGGGLPPELEPDGGVPVGVLRVRGARRDLGGPYECRVDSGVPPPARALVRLVVTYGPELEAEPEEGAWPPQGAEPSQGAGPSRGAGPVTVLVPEGATSAQLRCRARGVPGVELNWERLGHPLGNGELGLEFQSHQWREGPWTSSILTLPNVTGARSRLRHQFHQFHQFHQSQGGGATPRPRYRYQNVPQGPDWEHWEHWEGDGTLGSFVCVATNGRGTARREMRLRLGDRPDPPHSLQLSGVSPTSLSLSWRPGFDGGLEQHFLLRAEGPGAPPPTAALLTSGHALTLGGLLPATPYDVILRARNARGDSAPLRITATTSEAPEEPPRHPDPPPAAPPAGPEDSAVPVLEGALSALGGAFLAVLGAGLAYFRWGRGQRPLQATPDTPQVTPEGSSSPPSDLWDPPRGDWSHPYEEVEPWGGYEEVPPEPLVTPQGELV